MSSKILIVDDEKDILDTLQDLLEMEGYQVACALGVQKALIKFSEITPDLVITDMMMPGMNGLNLISLIREGKENSNVPIILMSAMASLSSKEEGGWQIFIKKPADIDVILKAISDLLSSEAKNNYSQGPAS